MTDTLSVIAGPFQANVTPTASHPRVVQMSNGDVLVAYATQLGGLPGNADGFHIRGQVFAEDGGIVQSEFPFNFSNFPIADRSFDIKSLPGNRVAVAAVVKDIFGASAFDDVLAGRFLIGAGGADREGNFAINSSKTATNFSPTITVGDSDHQLHFLRNSAGIHAVLQDSTSALDIKSAADRITLFGGSDAAVLKTCTLKNGNTVFLLDRDGESGADESFYFRIVRPDRGLVSDGEALAAPGRVFHPAIAPLANGGFVVAGTEFDGDHDIVIQVFDAGGSPVTGVTEIGIEDVPGRSNNNEPVLSPLPDGGFIVIYDKDAGSPEIRAQRFDRVGNQVGGDFLVTNENGGRPDAVTLTSGALFVAYMTLEGNVKSVLLSSGAKSEKMGREVAG